jgi:hypothetical protein
MAHQLAQVWNDPLGSRLDKPALVQLLNVSFDGVELVFHDAEQRAQRLAASGVTKPVNGR